MVLFKTAKKIKPKLLINIGALMDIPTASFITGAKGETITNGGLGMVTAVVGPGNSFKSTLIHYMMLSAADKIKSSLDTGMHTYDTEVNISHDRLDNLAKDFKYIGNNPVTRDEPLWTLADKTVYSADEWIVELRKYLDEKIKTPDVKYSPFQFEKNVYKDKPITFVEIDSLSEFESSTTMDMIASSTKDDASTNTLFMKQGLFKTKFFAEVPKMASGTNTYMFLTAHIGEKIDMGGMYAPKPTKKAQYLKNGDALKGVPNKFFYLTSAAWSASTAKAMINQTTKMPEYPKGKYSNMSTELNSVRLTMLRNKNGSSGYSLEILVSQFDGVLASLTEFHHVRSNDMYGLTGSKIHYALDILPGVKLQKARIREMLDADHILRRAVNITSEMLQLKVFHSHLLEDNFLCTPLELYNDIKDMGYNWDELLDTRGWWAPDQYGIDEKYLSTMDLLNMRAGKYHPFWMKTINKNKSEDKK